ncbi:MAG: DNA internalization-related competence protein ComEC/Rec2 [Lachnospira sp.]|nr:DNA internalization-related competence protein ComEC/Rec2 [Lachnospira sp.]
MECIRRPLCLIALAVIFIDICLLQLGVFENTPYIPDSFVNITGEVTAVKNMEYGVGYYLNNGIYVISDSGSEISVGDKLSVSGVVKEFQEPRNDGQFNQKLYYRSIGIKCQVKAKEISVISCSNLLSDNISQIKDNISDTFDKIAQGEDSAVLKAVILGDKSSMDKDYYSLYQRNGIAHLLAISGLHVSFVGMAIYRWLRKRGVSFILSFGMAVSFLVIYALLTGNGLSARRAIIMCVVKMGAEVLGKMYDALSALSLAAIVLITENPFVVVNAGFLLSFSAILGISLVVSPLSNIVSLRIDGWVDNIYFDTPVLIKLIKRAVRWGALSLVSSLGISIFMLPVILYYYFEVPVFSVILNIFVLPLMSVILFAGITGGMLALLCMPVGTFFMGSVHYILKFYQLLCTLTDSLPFNRWVAGRPEIWQIILYYIILLCAVYMAKRCHNRIKVLGTGIFLLVLTMSVKNPYDFQVHMIDVGQGDSIYISTDNLNMLFDGGSSDIKQPGKYRIYPFLKCKGVSRLDYVFISHSDSDHINGIIELIEMQDSSFRIKTVVMPDISFKLKDENYKELVEKAKQAGVKVLYANAGNICLNNNKLNISCLSPEMNETYSDINSSSAVYMVEYDGHRVILTGDMTKETEKKIMKTGIGKTDILKVAHHGSKTSSMKEFISKLSPDMAIISCGINNRYGHPDSETLEVLKDTGCNVFETDLSGQISIFYNKKTWVIKTKIK